MKLFSFFVLGLIAINVAASVCISRWLGGTAAIAINVGFSMLAGFLFMRRIAAAWRLAKDDAVDGYAPLRPVFDMAILIISFILGALGLLGPFTSLLALVLIVPPARGLIFRWMLRMIARAVEGGGAAGSVTIRSSSTSVWR